MADNNIIKLKDGINIISSAPVVHSKADEMYIDVQFPFGENSWNLWIPIYYRRTGLFLDFPGKEELDKPENLESRNILYDYLNKVYEGLPKSNNELSVWIEQQLDWWNENKASATVTVDYFKGAVLNTGKWMCTYCLQPGNSNPQRRIQDLKDIGYTVATKTKCTCEECKRKKYKSADKRTFIMMVPIARDGMGNGYEQWSSTLRERIINVLGKKDAYSNKKSKNVLPDHKFPEIRWDKKTKAKNPDNMTDKQIREKFQLLTNQHNEAKREACRKCRQTGQRPYPYGIKFYYDNNGKGTQKWNAPAERGAKAERGCVGCCWYDFEAWRKGLGKLIEEHQHKP